MNQEVVSFLKNALECSVLIDPVDPGLTFQELVEICKRVGFQEGEINDALPYVTTAYFGQTRLLPSRTDMQSWVFYFREEPEFRNFAAFDFVVAELNAATKSLGSSKASIQRAVLVERAVTAGISRGDIQVAITWQVMSNQLTDMDGILRFSSPGVRGLPSEQLKAHHPVAHRKPHRERVYPIVKDVIQRRTDGRPKHAEPLDAFAEALDALGYGAFRLWWSQTVAELRHVDPGSEPTSACVLAAALVEGSLTFIVSHARKHGAFQSSNYEKDPRTWKIDELVASAASGGPSAVLDPQAKARAETLIRTRQRIHAGRMLSDFPGGPPDIRPDESRAAKDTAEQVVRAILDWLQRNPAAS